MKCIYCWLFVGLSSALWVEAATCAQRRWLGCGRRREHRCGPRWSAGRQDRVQPVKSHGGRAHAVRGVLLTIHQADRPSSASLIAPQQWFSVVDVGLDACEITHYQAVARSSSGTQLRLMLTDRRSVIRLDCLTNIKQAHAPWSVTIHEVDDAATGKRYPCTRPLPTWMVRPTAMMIWSVA